VSIHNLNGLQKWLAKGKKRLAQFFASQSSIYSEGRQRGPYKKKGTVQSLRTQQHNRKKERDWTEKMRNDGYRDLCSFFRHKPTLLESGDDAQDSDQEELDKISSPFASGSFISDVTEDSADEDNDKELYPISMEPIAKREEENLGEIPEVPDAGPGPGAQWVPSRPPPTPPPGPDHVDQRIKDIENILHPKRKTGYGHIDSDLNYTLRTRLEMMLHFLRIYQINGYEGWIASSEQAARIGGRKAKWTARRLREWTHAFVRDTTNLPDHEYGKWNSSVLEDEDLAQEICLHLQAIHQSANLLNRSETPADILDCDVIVGILFCRRRQSLKAIEHPERAFDSNPFQCQAH